MSTTLQPAGQVAFHDLGRAGLDHPFPVAVERHYRVAGRPVRIAFSDETLASELGHALAHLERDPVSPPALTLHVVDRSAWPAYAETCDRLRNGTETMHLWDDSTSSGMWHQPWNHFSYFNADRAEGIFAVERPDRIPYYERPAIFRTVWEAWFRTLGLHLAHGAVIGCNGSGILLAGRGGRGKSTLTLACILAGMETAGDDFVPLEPGAAPKAWPLFASAKVFPDTVPLFQKLGPSVRVDWEEPNEKAVLYFPKDHPSFRRESIRIRAIVLPRYTGGASSRMLPGSKAEALRELLTSPQMMARGGRGPIFEFLTGLTRQLPVHLFETGNDWEEMTGKLRELIAELETAP